MLFTKPHLKSTWKERNGLFWIIQVPVGRVQNNGIKLQEYKFQLKLKKNTLTVIGILMATSKYYGELTFILYYMSSRGWTVIFYSVMHGTRTGPNLMCQLYVLCRLFSPFKCFSPEEGNHLIYSPVFIPPKLQFFFLTVTMLWRNWQEKIVELLKLLTWM